MSIFGQLATLLKNLPTKQEPARQPAFTGTTFNPNAQSFFDLIRAPQQPQFDVTAASGSKPKNYRPVAVSMGGMAAPAVFAMPGAAALPENVFTVTPASGTKPKNYKPVSIAMNAPSPAGPAAMQQMLAMMQATQSPFAPFGQG